MLQLKLVLFAFSFLGSAESSQKLQADYSASQPADISQASQF